MGVSSRASGASDSGESTEIAAACLRRPCGPGVPNSSIRSARSKTGAGRQVWRETCKGATARARPNLARWPRPGFPCSAHLGSRSKSVASRTVQFTAHAPVQRVRVRRAPQSPRLTSGDSSAHVCTQALSGWQGATRAHAGNHGIARPHTSPHSKSAAAGSARQPVVRTRGQRVQTQTLAQHVARGTAMGEGVSASGRARRTHKHSK